MTTSPPFCVDNDESRPLSGRNEKVQLTKVLPLQQTGCWVQEVLLKMFAEQVSPTKPVTWPTVIPNSERITEVTGLFA